MVLLQSGLTTGTDWEFYAHDGTFIAPKKYREYTLLLMTKKDLIKRLNGFNSTLLNISAC